MRIRLATPSDTPALAEIFLAARRQAFHWIPPERFSIADFEPQTAGEIVHLAHHEGGPPVGFISVWEPDRFIHHLFVAPAHQRTGIGTALLASLTWLPKPWTLKCLTANTPALEFYRRHRWRLTSRGTDSHGEYAVLQHA